MKTASKLKFALSTLIFAAAIVSASSASAKLSFQSIESESVNSLPITEAHIEEGVLVVKGYLPSPCIHNLQPTYAVTFTGEVLVGIWGAGADQMCMAIQGNEYEVTVDLNEIRDELGLGDDRMTLGMANSEFKFVVSADGTVEQGADLQKPIPSRM